MANIFDLRPEDNENYVVYVLATHSGLIEYAASGSNYRLLPATLQSVSLNMNSDLKAKLVFAASISSASQFGRPRPPSSKDSRTRWNCNEENNEDWDCGEEEEQWALSLDEERLDGQREDGHTLRRAQDDDLAPAKEAETSRSVLWRFIEYGRRQAPFKSRVLAEQARCYVESLRRLVPELGWREVVQMNRAVTGTLGFVVGFGMKNEGLKRRLMKSLGKMGPLRAIGLACLLHYLNSAELPNEDAATWPMLDASVAQRCAYGLSLALCPALQEPKGACRNVKYAFVTEKASSSVEATSSTAKKDKVYRKAKLLSMAEPAPLTDLRDLCRLLVFDKPLIAETMKMGLIYRGQPLPSTSSQSQQQQQRGSSGTHALEAYPKVLVCYRQTLSPSNCWNQLGMQTRSADAAATPGGDDQHQIQQGFLKNDHVSESAHAWYLQQKRAQSDGGADRCQHPIPLWRPYYLAHNTLNGDRCLFPDSKSLDEFVSHLRALWAHIETRAERFGAPASSDDSKKNIAIFQYRLSKSAYHLSPLLAHCFLASLYHQFVQLVFGTNIDVDFRHRQC